MRSLICLILLVPNAAEARDYNVALTTTRAVGDPVSVPIVVQKQPTTVRSLQLVLGFDSSLVAPTLPGGTITSSTGTTTTMSLTATPGEVSITYSGALPLQNAPICSVAFKCLKPGKCQFPIKSVVAKDSVSATIPMTGDTLDWLVITDSGAIRSAIE